MSNPTPADMAATGIDTLDLDRQLDRVKSRVFMGSHSAFLGSLMCSLELIWSTDVPTAATNGLFIWWNPHFFLRATPKLRDAVLVHELWHVGKLHGIRAGSRDPEQWNNACDLDINNGMDREGFVFENFKPWLDHKYDGLAEEDIYDQLMSGKIPPPPPNPFGSAGPDSPGDMVPLTKQETMQAVSNVITAVHQAKLANEAGTLPGAIEKNITKFLEPVINWQEQLMNFFTQLLDEDYTWARPNRRYADMYLPSKFTDDGRLEHLMYFCDASGSISDADQLRFNSEVKHIKEFFNPEKLTLVHFDTRITNVVVFNEDDPFDEVKVNAGGGTSLTPVKAMIDKEQPTAAIIFSDLYCAEMPPLLEDIPVLWVVVNNATANIPYGRKVHIK